MWDSLEAIQVCQWRWLIFPDNAKVRDIDTTVLDGRCWVEWCKGDLSGAPQKNRGLEMAHPGSWIWGFDDDNLWHPRQEEGLLEAIDRHPFAKVFLFGQEHPKHGIIRPHPTVEYAKVDLAQYFVNQGAVGECRFPLNEYASDWGFLQAVTAGRKPEEVVIVDKVCTYYNTLR